MGGKKSRIFTIGVTFVALSTLILFTIPLTFAVEEDIESLSPHGLTVTAISPTQIQLSWFPPTETFGQIIDGYTIERQITIGVYEEIIIVGSEITKFILSGLQTDKTYTYVVKANYLSGDSPRSNPVSATPTENTGYITIESNGTGGGDWNDGSTWSGGFIPTSNDKVIIKSGDTVNVTFSIYLEFFGSITIEQGGKLIITVTPETKVDSKSGESNEHLTRPTFGVSHETFESIIDEGFQFNTEQFPITDNHHTDFPEQAVKIGQVNSFSATVYADKGLKVQEFLFGIPDVGHAHLAELGVEVWYENGEITQVKAVQKSNVIDVDSIVAIHEKAKCQTQDIEKKCDTTNISMVFREPLADKIMAIKAIDHKNRYQITFLNEGIDVTGKSLNSMNTMMIPSNSKGEGLVEITQTAKYSPYWVTQDGRAFEKNSFGSFKQINQSFERFEDSGNPYTRMHSEFGKIVAYEQKLATKTFDSSKLESELPESFAYVYPESHERISEEMRAEMIEQEGIAEQKLSESTIQARW